MGGQRLDRGCRPKPVKIRTEALFSDGALTFDPRSEHLTVVGDERITVGRRGTRFAPGPIAAGRCFRKSGRRLNGRFPEDPPALRGDPGDRGVGHY